MQSTSICIAIDSTKPFDWNVLAEVALPPRAEPSLITDSDPPDDLRVCLIALDHRGQWGKNIHVEAHACKSILYVATSPSFSLYTRSRARARANSYSRPSSPQMQIEPLSEQLQISGDMVKAEAEILGQVVEDFQVESVPGTPRISLTLFN